MSMSSELQPVIGQLARLWRHAGRRRQRQFVMLLALMVLASLAEVLSIGAIIPFLGVVTAPERIFGHPAMQPYIRWFEIDSANQIILPLTLIFAFAAMFAGAVRLLLLWASTRLSFALGADLGIAIYRRTLFQSYEVHVSRNSSEIISGIATKTNAVIHICMMVLTLVSSAIIMAAILAALLSMDSMMALTLLGGFGVLYAGIVFGTHRRLIANSRRIAHESTQVVKSLQEGLGGIRDILINGSQDVYCDIYRNADLPSRRAQGSSAFIGSSPRFVMEALGMVLIAGLAYALARREDGGVSTVIPVLGAIALGAQRILPVLQQAYGAWSGIQGERAALQDVVNLLEQPLPEYAHYPDAPPLTFDSEIRLDHVCFSYGGNSHQILTDISLEIRKGSRIGFVGITGSGKSTLLDIIMGLLPPTSGTISIDGVAVTTRNHRSWQSHIAHVPQSIFLADSTIAENIAFGIPPDQIDHERVRSAAKQAQISQVIERLPEQYQARVGERGVRLSGGQRQRIGIARALYRKPSVIIFDEATSALDSETEQAVMDAIEGLSRNLTILIVAHRITTLRNCGMVVELGGGKVLRMGSYESILQGAA